MGRTVTRLQSNPVTAHEVNNRNIITMQSLRNEKIINESIKGFYYSKKEHGPLILRNIDPDKVKEQCGKYFSRSYFSLQ